MIRQSKKFKKVGKSVTFFFTFKKALLTRLLPGMFFASVITCILVYGHIHHDILDIKISAALPSYMGAALGLLLVFRNSTAYEKWWEARKEIGALVNTCRNFAIDLNGLLPHDNKEKIRIAKLSTAFVFALKGHLRDGVDLKEIEHIESEDYKIVEKSQHKPNVLCNIMTNRIEVLWKEKLISDMQQYLLLTKVNGLIDILGKCERIRNTPIPGAYAVLLKFFIFIYVIILPFSLVDDIGWACIPMVLLLYFILMSIVATAEEIEEPFGYDLNDLPMDTISENIRKNVMELVDHA